MQFKYPEILWALLLLLIPIIIHLFQLRRFRKTAFTNVSLLRKVIAQTRKSRSLKKWLLLITRLLLLASIILGFAQPYFASENLAAKKETVIYLDDSFSMQAQSESLDLLEIAKQDLIKTLPREKEISIFTNIEIFEKVSAEDVQNQLLSLSHTHEQLNLQEVLLKARGLFRNDEDTRQELIIISDFQERMYRSLDSIEGLDVHFVKLSPDPNSNIVLDSVFIGNSSPTQLELRTALTASGEISDIPVSVWNADTLIAKTAAKFGEEGRAVVDISLPKDIVIDGKIELSDTGLQYDNQIYFNINPKEKINILAIGSGQAEFLNRIFLEEEFNLEQFDLSNLNYSDIDKQNLIVLNQIQSIPKSLENAIHSFSRNGGGLVLIPHPNADKDNYNSFMSQYYSSKIGEAVSSSQRITTISFDHPLYKNVFEKSVTNFQYPKVESYYKLSSAAPTILRFENGDPFLIGDNGVFIFTAPLDLINTDFQNSPLVVPSFYNMGALSLQLPALYHSLSSSTRIDIPVTLPSDKIARVVKNDYEFIPLQQSFSNKTTLDFESHPSEDGIFDIVLNDSLISRISFNYPRLESQMNYVDISEAPVSSINSGIPQLFDLVEKNNQVKELWKWFVILALLFVLIEVLVQKLVK